MEIIIRALAMNCTLYEVPIVFVDRIYGESKIGPGEIVTYLKSVWRLMGTDFTEK